MVGEKGVLPFPTLFPELMAASLQHMAELEVDKLLFAHGGVLDIEDANTFFTGLLNLVGEPNRLSFRLIEPLCSLAADVRLYKKSRKNLGAASR
jgi:hypothetical protein